MRKIKHSARVRLRLDVNNMLFIAIIFINILMGSFETPNATNNLAACFMVYLAIDSIVFHNIRIYQKSKKQNKSTYKRTNDERREYRFWIECKDHGNFFSSKIGSNEVPCSECYLGSLL